MKTIPQEINFPYPALRKGQSEFINKVLQTIENKQNLIICAPTGSGKTISAISPALHLAKKNNLKIICLTSRQTQANQIIKTLKDISTKSNEKINYTAFIGKQNMCVHPDKNLYPASDFNEFCKKAKESGKCPYYKNTKNQENEKKINTIITQSTQNFQDIEQFIALTETAKLCPYELSAIKASKSEIIICDYNYLFSPGITQNFLGKINKTIDEHIIIVDEAHNLPDRIRNANSPSLSTQLTKNAIKELKDYIKNSQQDKYIYAIDKTLKEILLDKIESEKNSYLTTKQDFIEKYLSNFKDTNLDHIIDELRKTEQIIKEERIISYCGRVANFLENWQELGEENYIRVLEKEIAKNKTILSLKIKCIDPGEISSDILNNSHSSILMSATISPIQMYKDILSLNNCQTLELESPFEKKNQLTLVIDDVTSKYTARCEKLYQDIANHLEEILNTQNDKNTITFFPSYAFMENVTSKINILKLNRKILKEQKNMTKEQKEKYIQEFKKQGLNTISKSLFAVTSGSFAEGLDLPNKELEIVIIVGLPLAVPDTSTQAIINHFEKKFKKGQLYGYIYPAMNKIIQAAGRCIRTENDKGAVILMDCRFLWPLYAQSFPKHWHMSVVENNAQEIKKFFGNQ